MCIHIYIYVYIYIYTHVKASSDGHMYYVNSIGAPQRPEKAPTPIALALSLYRY